MQSACQQIQHGAVENPKAESTLQMQGLAIWQPPWVPLATAGYCWLLPGNHVGYRWPLPATAGCNLVTVLGTAGYCR